MAIRPTMLHNKTSWPFGREIFIPIKRYNPGVDLLYNYLIAILVVFSGTSYAESHYTKTAYKNRQFRSPAQIEQRKIKRYYVQIGHNATR